MPENCAPGVEYFWRPVSLVTGSKVAELLGDPSGWQATHTFLEDAAWYDPLRHTTSIALAPTQLSWADRF